MDYDGIGAESNLPDLPRLLLHEFRHLFVNYNVLEQENGLASSTGVHPMMPRASYSRPLRPTGSLPATEAGETLVYLWSSERCRTSRCARSLLINAA